MCRARCRAAGLGALLCLCLTGPAAADPLRLIPAQADLVVKAENPRAILDSYARMGAVQGLLRLDAVREALDSTNARRLYQLFAYFEDKLGADRYELLDKLAGGGVAFAVKTGKPSPALLVLRGKDAETSRRFVQLALDVIEQELARQESKQKVVRTTYRDVEAASIDEKVFVAVLGDAIVLANRGDALKAAVEMHLGEGRPSVLTNKALAKARQTLPPNPDVWAWFNLAPVQKLPGFQEAVKDTTNNPVVYFFGVGGVVDLIRTAPEVVGGVYLKDGRHRATIRFPAGLDAIGDRGSAFFPSGKDGSLPPLEPPAVLFSSSYYLDPARLWEQRDKVFRGEEFKNLDKFERDSGKFLGGTKLSQLMEWSGRHQRFVAAQQTESVYKDKKPQLQIPAFALVHEMRDPEQFTRAADRILRTVALLGAFQFRLKLVEEKYGDTTIVSYRFPEDRAVKEDAQNLRFAFSPSYAWVGDQFIASSTLGLARDLIDELREEKRGRASPAGLQMRAYSTGVSAGLRQVQEQIVAQGVLAQALTPDEARAQFEQLLRLVDDIGTLTTESVYGPRETRFHFGLNYGKQR